MIFELEPYLIAHSVIDDAVEIDVTKITTTGFAYTRRSAVIPLPAPLSKSIEMPDIAPGVSSLTKAHRTSLC